MQRRQGIQEACRQAPEAAVAQTRIDLLRRDVFEIVAELAQGGTRLLQ